MEKEKKPKHWGRFQLVELLGSGGMGDVYKAYDPHLKRYIALKILRHEDPEVVRRFLREARSQARVEHIHVCKIYESGQVEGHPFIAMQYIDGENLKELCDRLTLEEKIKIIKDVALGLHAAHSQGLIHRDMKPANVMVKQSEEGQWKPFIMDFGIAREQAAPGLTSTGMVVGTPFYMSPEHARGKQGTLDRRSDIYSLGVTMFELFSGSVPFDGDTPVDILMQVIQKDAKPLRKINPRIPVDIETIVMKCLEKDANRRYASAKELAADLQHYLDGDPIMARPATITYRIKRKISKHKLPSALIGAASLIIIVLVALWLNTRWTASRRAVIAQELGQEVEKIESTIRYAHLLPLHNISQEKESIRQRIVGIEGKMKEVGKLGVGPGHYAVGRGFLALQEHDKAKDHLDQAWQAGYQTAEVAYDLGRALGELYLKESEKANRIFDKELRDARKKEIEKMYREPAVRFLRQGGQAQNESQEYSEALIAFYEKEFARALAILQAAQETNRQEEAWLYQAKLLEGNIYLEMGREREQSNFDDAQKDYSRAEEAFQEVIKRGRSDIRGYLGLSLILEREIMIMFNTRGGDIQPLVDEAIDRCEKALQIDPGLANVYVMKSAIYRWLGRYQMISGSDPVQAFDLSRSAAQSAIEREPENFEAHSNIGIANRLKGQYRMNRGQDPSQEFQAAAESFKKAIAINPTYETAYYGMGNLYVRMAQYEMSQGKDPKASLDEAISIYERALSINPRLVNLHNGLAAALWFQGGAMMSRGEDPRPSFLKAVQSMKNAIQLNPSVGHFYSNLGFVYMDIGRYELDHGFSPGDTANEAVAYFEKAIEINPKGNELYLGLVSVSGILTQYDHMMGRDCRKRVSQASGYFKRGLEVNPNDPLIYIRMAGNWIVQARYLLDRSQSPAAILDQAAGLLQKAREINPKNHEIYVQDGEISLLKGEWQSKRRQNPLLDFRRAEALLNQAADLNPKDIQVHLTRARLQRGKAEWNMSRGLRAADEIDAGLAVLEDALAINPNHGETYALKGVLLSLRAQTTADESARLSAQVQARTSLLEAVKINRNLQTLYAPFLQKK